MRQHTQLVDAENNIVKNKKGELVYEGREKKLIQTDAADFIIQEFRSNGTEERKKRVRGNILGALRNDISCYLFEYLDGFHIPTHFVRKVSESEMMVKRLAMIPVIAKMYNIATGSLVARFGLKERTPLGFPVIEHYYKDVEHDITWVNEHHMYAFGILTPEEFQQLNRLSSKINAVLRALCDRRQLLLADLQLKFGRYKGQLTLGDELSPLTCRFFDLSLEDNTAQDRFGLDKENADEACVVLRNRLQLKV